MGWTRMLFLDERLGLTLRSTIVFSCGVWKPLVGEGDLGGGDLGVGLRRAMGTGDEGLAL